MDVRRKLHILADAAKYDASCASSGSTRAATPGGIGNTEGMGICHSYTPDGRCVSLLKILFTNYCIYDCHYCINRISSDVERARFTPREVVDLTIEFYRRNYIEGLFLSSGIVKSADATMSELVEVARSLRHDHKFGGYIHLKVPPGVSRELIDTAGLLVDRLSVNVELPTQADLTALAPEKTLDAIESSMAIVKNKIDEAAETSRFSRIRAPAFVRAGQSTQMIVGATPATDADILETASRLYTGHKLRRVYYSAFSPIPHADVRLPGKAPPLVREHRLYEADWLVRFYGFTHDELVNAGHPNLDLDIDPKLAWALAHRERFPVDVNLADREMLLRIPGLGTRNVDRIVAMRKHRTLTLDDLARLRVAVKRASPFLAFASDKTSGAAVRRLDAIDLARHVRPPKQLALFESEASAISGEL